MDASKSIWTYLFGLPAYTFRMALKSSLRADCFMHFQYLETVSMSLRISTERKSIYNKYHHVARKFHIIMNCFTVVSFLYIHSANIHVQPSPSAWSGFAWILATGIRWLAPIRRVSLLLWSPCCVAKENMMTAPGAVQASQLIPEQAIGC